MRDVSFDRANKIFTFVFIAVAIIVMVVIIFGISSITVQAEEPVVERFDVSTSGYCEDTSNKYTVIVDKETGVQYLIIYYSYGTGITPLYNADGTLMIYDGDEK